MGLTRQAIMAAFLLTAMGGCAASRQSGGANVRPADSGGTNDYRSWNDVNNQPLPRVRSSPRNNDYPWQSGTYTDTSTPPLR